MSLSPRSTAARLWKSVVAVGLIALVGMAAPASGAPAEGESANRPTRTLDVELSARELGLPADASAKALARSALGRSAKRLGLERSAVRLDSRVRMPAADGARALEQLRFQQRAGGLRVVWSQIDVTVVAGRVLTISATVVPVAGRDLVGDRRVSRKRALGVALRAVPGATEALDPLPAAYAGSPRRARDGDRRRARRAWVVEVRQPAEAGEESPTPLCIVVDAQSGKVIARWPGIADRPESGPQARGADTLDGVPIASAGLDRVSARDVRDGPAFTVLLWDGRSSADPFQAPRYAQFITSDDPRTSSNWPSYQAARLPGVTPVPVLEAASANIANVARTICDVRGYCGVRGGFQPDADIVWPWPVFGGVPGSTSAANPFDLRVSLSVEDTMAGNGNPNVPANDVVAHEFGHLMDIVYAGDRCLQDCTGPQPREISEAFGDMFAYEYDRFDPTFGEETQTGLQTGRPYRNWANPGAESEGGRPYPAHMNDYYTVNGRSPHLNSTILSHAYYRFVQSVGHTRAGRVLHNVPSLLPPQPTFADVAMAFRRRACSIYGGTTAVAADAAFDAVGITTNLSCHV